MKKLKKKYTNSELAESFVFRSQLNAAQKEESLIQLQKARKIIKDKLTDREKLYASVLQLRYQIEDYANSNSYDKDLTFSHFLRSYINLRYKVNKEFARDIDIEETELSLILNNHRAPTKNTIVRIELQSSIPAVFWYKLVEKQKEFELQTDQTLRNNQVKHVKNRLELKF